MSGFDQSQADLYGLFRTIIKEETKWLRHYQGKVLKNEDPDNLNRVNVSIPELGLSITFWAYPRDKNGISVPAIGSDVEIYFMDGSPSRPVYMGLAWEGVQNSLVKNFTGDPTKHVIFEDPAEESVYISAQNKVIDIAKILSLDVAKKALTILQGTEPFILGNAFKTYFDAHVHTSAAPSSPTSAPTIPMPSTTLSTVIKGK